ncbi:MAG: hypothetical protein ABFD97_12775 [Syntrophobacter sp.]
MLSKVFSDDAGNLSSMRLVFVMVVATVLFNWTWMNIHTGVMQPLDFGSVASLIGMGWVKAQQKASEATAEQE